MTKELPDSRASGFDPLGAAWRFLAAPQTLVVLMGCIAFALAAGTLIPQITVEITDHPQTWLASQSGFWDQQSHWLRVLGLNDVYHAPWFHLLLALAGLCLFVRLIEAVELAYQTTIRRTWTLKSFAFWGRHRFGLSFSITQPPDLTHTTTRDFFIQRGYRWTDLQGLDSDNSVAIRRGPMLWAQPVLHLGLLGALLGLLIAGTWGWQHQDWRPAPGEGRTVGHGLPYVMRLEAFRLPETGEGERGFTSQIVWLDGDDSVRHDVLTVGRPTRFEGVTVRQLGYVPVVKLRAWDQDGLPLDLQPAGAEMGVSGEVEVTFPSSEALPLVLIPSQDRFLALSVAAECSNGRPVLQVSTLGHDGGDMLRLGTLTESGSLSGDGLRVAADVHYRPILRVDRRPAMGLILAGMILALVAFSVSWLVPTRLVWVASQAGGESETIVEILVPAAGWGHRWLGQTAERLEEDLTSVDQ